MNTFELHENQLIRTGASCLLLKADFCVIEMYRIHMIFNTYIHVNINTVGCGFASLLLGLYIIINLTI